MNDLMTVGDVQTMSSREIAELTGKEHKHIIRDIRTIIEQLKDGPNLDHEEFQSLTDDRGEQR
ncbi:anti-repressor Ant [Klebsiella phage MEW1]|uniref:DNA-binding protein n=1 Tax=Klebsiella phage MEW1 TaxID=2776813 RepID=A0A7M1IDN4_9CAUD|nr:anti-repressor Ant [Klebsiella phage MEW1]QOQ37670.1 DNA-binding protein [Klebsiella phage MEW1]